MKPNRNGESRKGHDRCSRDLGKGRKCTHRYSSHKKTGCVFCSCVEFVAEKL